MKNELLNELLMVAFGTGDKKIVESCQKFLQYVETKTVDEKKINRFRQIILNRLENNVEACRKMRNLMTVVLYEAIGTC